MEYYWAWPSGQEEGVLFIAGETSVEVLVSPTKTTLHEKGFIRGFFSDSSDRLSRRAEAAIRKSAVAVNVPLPPTLKKWEWIPKAY